MIDLSLPPTEMLEDERLFLYSLIRGCQPSRVLEIGTGLRGSATIITAALDENGKGEMASLDPVSHSNTVLPRFHFICGPSPESVPEAIAQLGGPADFVLIDGIHIYKQALKDLEAAFAHTAQDAYILLHDALHHGVNQAIADVVRAHRNLYDCGFMCRSSLMGEAGAAGHAMPYCGFRLLRKGGPVVDSTPFVQPMWEAIGSALPGPDLLNHDNWYCRTIEPCASCRA